MHPTAHHSTTTAELAREYARRLTEQPDQYPQGGPLGVIEQRETDQIRPTLIGLGGIGFATRAWQLGNFGGDPYSFRSTYSGYAIRAAVAGLADTDVRDRLAAFAAAHDEQILLRANPIKLRWWHQRRPGVPTGEINGHHTREFAAQIDRRQLAVIAPGADPEQTWTVALVARDWGPSDFWTLIEGLAAEATAP